MEGFFMLLIVFLLIAGFATAAHAEKNGKTPLWGVVVGLFGLIGLMLYAISLASD